MINIPQKITKDSFSSLWEVVKKEGIKAKKAERINRAITIFSQIFFAISISLFGFVIFYTVFKNDSEALPALNYIGTKIMRLFPDSIPNIIKVIICLILTIITPAVCCLFVRVIFSLFSAEYENNDMGKDGLAGAQALKQAVNKLKKQREHYDITWDLPEIWVYHLIFPITFLLPIIIQLYFSADKTAEGITTLIFMELLVAGLGGLILFSPIAGLKAISNFLCNRTCVFLKSSKEKEYTSLIKVLSDYIQPSKKEIKSEKEAKQKQEKEKEKRNEAKIQYKQSQTSASPTKPINEYDSFTWTNEYVHNNEEKCSSVALSTLKVSKELLEEGDYSGAAAGFDKVVRALELLKNIDSEYYLPPLFANCYALSQIFAFGLNNKASACKYAKKACEYAERCNSDTSRTDLAVMRDLCNALDSSNSISSILDEFDINFPYDILRMN